MQGLSSSLTLECGQWKFLTSVQFDNIVVIVWGSQAVPHLLVLVSWAGNSVPGLRVSSWTTPDTTQHQVVQEVNPAWVLVGLVPSQWSSLSHVVLHIFV